MFWIQLQFFSRCSVGINYCNATPFLYRPCFFQTTVCNNFVSNGNYKATKKHIRDKLHFSYHLSQKDTHMEKWLSIECSYTHTRGNSWGSPKGPCGTKNTNGLKITTAIVIRYRYYYIVIHYPDSNLDAVFPGKNDSESVKMVKHYRESNTLRFPSQ